MQKSIENSIEKNMVQPLIVHPNQDFANRMQSEAGSKALVTTSYIQGLRWIADPKIPISGIYLNPNDSSYSAIKFLNIALLQRPATPTFILDDEGGLSNQNFNCLSDKFRIQRAFKGQVKFQDLLQPLQVQVPEELMALTEREPIQSKHEGYIAVPVIDFIHSKKYPFNVFVEDESGGLRFFAMEESEIDLDYLTFLSKQTKNLYVEESSIQSRKESFKLVESAYLDPDYLSPSWRSAETLYRTKLLLEELRKTGVSDEVTENTYNVMENLFQLVSQLSKDAYLRKFVDQARQCDRTVECATLSVLMCKKLKFESTASSEHLGLASFFQDISLYNSPFGNISDQRPSELSPAAYEYYLKHPDLSADLVAKVASVPEVSRQIIRQHHERADRTGFPKKIGGPQLQPLAEILSLVNAYIDARNESAPTPGAPNTIPVTVLQEEVLVHYNESSAMTFREILAALGKLK